MKVASYLFALLAVFAIAFAVGRVWGPEPAPAPAHDMTHTVSTDHQPTPGDHGSQHS